VVASAGYDGLRLWEVLPGGGHRSFVLLDGQAGAVWGVAISADGQLVASGGDDGTVRLWQAGPDAQRGRALAVLEGHAGPVRSVSLSADGRWVASGGLDGTVKLWDSASCTLTRTMRPDRRFERMDITGLTGIAEAQRAVLLALGAVERIS
jgi:WD40 repeat protein